MLQTLKNIFSVKDIRKKLLFTVFIILLFRFGTFISVPGFNKILFNEQAGAAGVPVQPLKSPLASRQPSYGP